MGFACSAEQVQCASRQSALTAKQQKLYNLNEINQANRYVNTPHVRATLVLNTLKPSRGANFCLLYTVPVSFAHSSWYCCC